MRNIETRISPLIKSMFPSFYLEEGENFIAFMEAYYEWLEQNFQLIRLEDNTGFVVGATIKQEDVSGTIVAFVDSSLLVLIDELNTFKCVNVCSELIPVTTVNPNDGITYTTYIQKGGTTQRLGTLFLSRNLANMRDIDTTMDLFIVKFKEKYLKNIEFDIATNKKLLIKNSFDLYRSKGTSRSIDLFFRLIYGINTEVYYPGDNLFKLSDAEWVKPQYIEINPNSVTRAVALVGKQIRGANSGATAFVERYVKQKVNGSFIHVLYVSSVYGEFTLNEILYDKTIYPDSPIVFGSLSSLKINTRSLDFEVGDLVDISSETGLDAVGRVEAVSSSTGEVEFTLIDSGFGYTQTSYPPSYGDSDGTQSLVSNTNISLENVRMGKILTDIYVNSGGSGFNNTDIIFVRSRYLDARAKPITNSSGSIVETVITFEGAGFDLDPTRPQEIEIMDSTGTTPSSGVDVNLGVTYDYPKTYAKFLSSIYQTIYETEYINAADEEALAPGSHVEVGSENFGVITQRTLSTESNNGKLVLSMYNKGAVNDGDIVKLVSNPSVAALIYQPQNISANARVMHVSNTASVKVAYPTGTFAPGDFIYQVDSDGNYIASASIEKTSELSLVGGYINVNDFNGLFRPQEIYVEGKSRDTTFAQFESINFDIGLTDRNGNFTDLQGAEVYTESGFVANVSVVFGGSNASFKIGSLTDVEPVLLNYDRLSTGNIMDTKLNALAYGLDQKPEANSQSIIFSALRFATFDVGSIDSLTQINPGKNYTADPFVEVFQPYISGLQLKDLIFNIEEVVGSFVVGENITQTVTVPRTGFNVEDSTGFVLGELLNVANTSTNVVVANGVIDFVYNSGNYVVLKDIKGNMPANTFNYTLKSIISTANSKITDSDPANKSVTLKAKIKSVTPTTIYAKRIQVEDFYNTNLKIVGSLTGATANIVSVETDTSTKPIGMNAFVYGDALTSNGSVMGIQIINSGYGFTDNQLVTYTSQDGSRSGTANGFNSGIGLGPGYYNNKRGFLSDTSKVHDGDYYQEYSYDILSRFPLDKYGDMFKKVMHTAGTRVFGNVLVDSDLNVKVTAAPANTVSTFDEILQGNTNGSVTVSNTSSYIVQDRASIDVEDRFNVFIEIRE